MHDAEARGGQAAGAAAVVVAGDGRREERDAAGDAKQSSSQAVCFIGEDSRVCFEMQLLETELARLRRALTSTSSLIR